MKCAYLDLLCLLSLHVGLKTKGDVDSFDKLIHNYSAAEKSQ
jgi:hypothetical protein